MQLIKQHRVLEIHCEDGPEGSQQSRNTPSQDAEVVKWWILTQLDTSSPPAVQKSKHRAVHLTCTASLLSYIPVKLKTEIPQLSSEKAEKRKPSSYSEEAKPGRVRGSGRVLPTTPDFVSIPSDAHSKGFLLLNPLAAITGWMGSCLWIVRVWGLVFAQTGSPASATDTGIVWDAGPACITGSVQ